MEARDSLAKHLGGWKNMLISIEVCWIISWRDGAFKTHTLDLEETKEHGYTQMFG